MSDGFAHPDMGTLLDWLQGHLDADAAARVSSEVASGDPRIRATVQWLRGFLTTAKALPLHDPPPIVAQNLNNFFRRWSEARAVLQREPVERRARLLFDSRKDLAVAGIRAAADSDTAFHLAYTTADADLVLDVYRLGSGRVRLDGQVLLSEPTSAPVFEASAHEGNLAMRTVDGDELGRFRLADVSDGVRELHVTNGQIVIVAALDLGGTD